MMEKKLPGLIILMVLQFRISYAMTEPANTDAVVAKDGSGDYTTIQAAVNAAPNNSAERFVIYIKSGVYTEPVKVNSTKKNLVLYGEHDMQTIITYKTEQPMDLATLDARAEKKVVVQVHDLSGQLIFQQECENVEGVEGNIKMQSDLERGIYILRVISGETSLSGKISVK